MINLPLMRKTFRDHAYLYLGAMLLVTVFVVLFMVAINAVPIEKGMSDWLRLPFIRRLMTVMIGSDLLSNLTPTSVACFAFTHPMMWILVVSFTLTMASGVFAGEIDRGTIDLVASLPISRSEMYVSHSLLLYLMGLPLCWAVWLGMSIGRHVAGALEVRMDLLQLVTWNLYACFILIASFSLAISSMCSRRGVAASIAFVLVFYAFVLNVLRAMWPAMERLAWSDFLHYYQSLMIVRDQAMRWHDVSVLLASACVWWIAGFIVFRRRDIPAR